MVYRYWVWRNSLYRVILLIITSGFISGSPNTTSGFSIFTKAKKYYLYTYLVLRIKFGASILISFEILSTGCSSHSHTHTHIHVYAQTNFQKPIFWTQVTWKHINQVKTRYRKFWQNTILPLSNSDRVMEVKIWSEKFQNQVIEKNYAVKRLTNKWILDRTHIFF